MKTNELRKLTTEDLRNKIMSSKEELLKLRMKQATGSLENPARMHELKKEIARCNTIIREREIEG